MQGNGKRLCVVLCGVFLASILLAVANAIAVEPPGDRANPFCFGQKGKEEQGYLFDKPGRAGCGANHEARQAGYIAFVVSRWNADPVRFR